MIEHRDAHLLARDRPMIVDPGGRLTPGVFVGLAFAVDDLPALLAVDVHARGHANAKSAFLGIAEGHGVGRGLERDVEVDDPHIALGAACDAADVFALFLAVGIDPIVGGADERFSIANFDCQKLAMHDRAEAACPAGILPALYEIGSLQKSMPLTSPCVNHSDR